MEYPTLAQCHYCDKEKLIEYYNLVHNNFINCSAWWEKFQILRDRMWEEDLMCSILPSKKEQYIWEKKNGLSIRTSKAG